MEKLLDLLGNTIEPGKMVVYVEGHCPNLQLVKAVVLEVEPQGHMVNPYRIKPPSIKVHPTEKSKGGPFLNKESNSVVLRKLETIMVLNER